MRKLTDFDILDKEIANFMCHFIAPSIYLYSEKQTKF